MFCCVGLIGGVAVGQYLGGPWTYIAPAAGFGIGLAADMKFMKHMHGNGGQNHMTCPISRQAKDSNPDLRMEAVESKVEQELQPMGKGESNTASGMSALAVCPVLERERPGGVPSATRRLEISTR